jgi:hypothetical protein
MLSSLPPDLLRLVASYSPVAAARMMRLCRRFLIVLEGCTAPFRDVEVSAHECFLYLLQALDRRKRGYGSWSHASLLHYVCFGVRRRAKRTFALYEANDDSFVLQVGSYEQLTDDDDTPHHSCDKKDVLVARRGGTQQVVDAVMDVVCRDVDWGCFLIPGREALGYILRCRGLVEGSQRDVDAFVVPRIRDAIRALGCEPLDRLMGSVGWTSDQLLEVAQRAVETYEVGHVLGVHATLLMLASWETYKERLESGLDIARSLYYAHQHVDVDGSTSSLDQSVLRVMRHLLLLIAGMLSVPTRCAPGMYDGGEDDHWADHPQVAVGGMCTTLGMLAVRTSLYLDEAAHDEDEDEDEDEVACGESEAEERDIMPTDDE